MGTTLQKERIRRGMRSKLKVIKNNDERDLFPFLITFWKGGTMAFDEIGFRELFEKMKAVLEKNDRLKR